MTEQGANSVSAVLVVDDDPHIAKLYTAILKRQRIHVYVAANLDEAKRLLAEKPVGVVLCDYVLSDGNGLQFVTGLKESHPQLSHILITGYSSEDLAIRGINEADLTSFLTKPCSATDLVAAVKRALEEAAARYKHIQTQNPHNRHPLSGPFPNFRETSSGILRLGVLILLVTAAVGIAIALLFVILYLLKSTLGFDLIPNMHIDELFFTD